MAVFTRPVTFASLDGSASLDAEAVIDTGSQYCLIPQEWAEQFGLPRLGEEDAELADGTMLRMVVAAVRVVMQGRARIVTALLGPSGVTPLIGASTLAEFSFGVDPAGERLIPQVVRLLQTTHWPTW